jgi:hypothetical protein
MSTKSSASTYSQVVKVTHTYLPNALLIDKSKIIYINNHPNLQKLIW